MQEQLYFIHCSDGTIYTGISHRLEERLWEHDQGVDPTCYTYSRRPLRFLGAVDFPTRFEALEAERKIKLWSKAKKLAFIAGDMEKLRWLAKSSKEKRRLKKKIHKAKQATDTSS